MYALVLRVFCRDNELLRKVITQIAETYRNIAENVSSNQNIADF